MAGCILTLLRLESRIREFGDGRHWHSPGVQHLVACQGTVPKNGVWGQITQQLNSFCYPTSSFNTNFVYTHVAYMTYVHGKTIYPRKRMMTVACICTLCTHKVSKRMQYLR